LNEPEMRIELEGGQIALQSLELKENTFMEILSEDGELNLFVPRRDYRQGDCPGKVAVRSGPRSEKKRPQNIQH
jgi:hypothetical protein